MSSADRSWHATSTAWRLGGFGVLIALGCPACDIGAYGPAADFVGSEGAGTAGSPAVMMTGGSAGEGDGQALDGPGSYWDPWRDVVTASVPRPAIAAATLPPASVLCGDGVRDPATEECDDGGDIEPLDLCTPTCQLEDAVVEVQVPGEPAPFGERARLGRRLGEGRHPIAPGPGGFAVAYVTEPVPAVAETAPFVGVALYDFPTPRVFTAPFSHRDPHPLIDASAGTLPLITADPVVAAFDDGRYAVAYTSFGDDGDALGVLLRTITPSSDAEGTLGPVVIASADPFASQYDADLLALPDDRLLVAWTDDRDPISGPDLYYRVFSSSLTPLVEMDLPLATTPAAEGAVALAPFGGGWAAAWRASATTPTEEGSLGFAGGGGAAGGPPGPADVPEGQPSGRELIEVETSDGVHFTVLEPTEPGTLAPFLPGPAGDRPALVQVGPRQLLVLFTVGTDPQGIGVAEVGRLRIALCDLDAPGEVAAVALPFSAAVNADPSRAQSQPSATVVGDLMQGVIGPPELGGELFLAWRTAASLSDPVDAADQAPGEQLWLKPVWLAAGDGGLTFDVDGTGVAVSWGEEFPLPRWSTGEPGDQRTPALAAADDFGSQSPPFDVTGALVAAWEDFGSEHGTAEAEPDVLVQLAPLPRSERSPERLDCGSAPGEQCGNGEGHCESDAECESGLVCAAPPAPGSAAGIGLGPNFGFGPEIAVCVPAHCNNGVQDSPGSAYAPDHEDGVDCGGIHCGECFTCGDGLLAWMLGEYCDDGNRLPGDGCSPDCQSSEACGNGIVDTAVGETCDDGNRDDDDECTSDCQAHRCGDGIVHGTEACDSGGLLTADCDADCSLPSCGDGIVNPFAGEDCEPPGASGCSASCQAPSGCTNPSGCLHVESMPDAVGNNDLRLYLHVVNSTSSSVNLYNYRLRYWAALDPCTAALPNCNLAVAGCYHECNATTSIATVSPVRSRADRRLTLTFRGPVLAPGAMINIELHAYQTGWPQVNETNDYSYLAATTHTPNPRIALYNPYGTLVWGEEPGAAVCGDGLRDPGEACDARTATSTCDADCTAVSCGDLTLNRAAGEVCDLGPSSPLCTTLCRPSYCGDGVVNLAAAEACDVFLTPTCRTPDCDGFLPGLGCTNGNLCLKVQSHPEGSPTDGQIEPYVHLVNQGPDAVPLRDLTLRYWFTADGRDHSALTLDCYYLQGANCGSELTSVYPLVPALDGADSYYELSLPSSSSVIARGASVELKTAFHLPPSWPPFDETDDYSYQASTGFVDNPHITLYRSGEIVWGEEPGPTTICGDFAVDGPEDCDEGGETATCDADCTVAECGDALTNATAGEDCDEGGESATCDADCTIAECGDGVENETAGESCDTGGESATCDADCSPALCGDHQVNASAAEVCDDGNFITETTCAYGVPSCTGCNASCTTVLNLTGPYCGDGILQASFGEECDPGIAGTSCNPDCTRPTCMDPTTCLHVLSKRGNGDAPTGNGDIVPFIELVNPTSQAIPLSELAVRYWFRSVIGNPSLPACMTGPQLVADCYYATLDQASYTNVCSTQVARSFTVLAPALPSATHYLQLTFPNAPALGAGRRTGEIQHRIHKCDWSYFEETGDHSWRNYTNYTVNTAITIYRNGSLIWGNEP